MSAGQGVLAEGLQSSPALRQARSGGEPVEENAFSLMSFQGVDRKLPNEQCRDAALEHRRWLEFGLGTNAKRFAPIRQGEGVSRTISGDSKERSVLWRVFLCYLSSREERWHPRRAFPFEKRFVSLKAVTGVVQTELAVQREADCHVAALAAPRNDTWTNCGGTPQVRWNLDTAV